MKVIITGTTGMVGKGVLIECLYHPKVESILIINRTSIGLKHPKLKEVIHSNFFNLTKIENELKGYDACFFCLGVSSMGMKEEEYHNLTYNLVINFAKTVYKLNPNMVFNYVSGQGTDSTEKGRIMWARVKGKTENTILKMGFKDAYMFRPGVILPEKGVKSKVKLWNILYAIMKPLFPLLENIKSITTSSKLGVAMINSVLQGFDKKYLENTEINQLAKVK